MTTQLTVNSQRLSVIEKGDVNALAIRVAAIEVRNSTNDITKRFSWQRFNSLIALTIAAITAIVMYFHK